MYECSSPCLGSPKPPYWRVFLSVMIFVHKVKRRCNNGFMAHTPETRKRAKAKKNRRRIEWLAINGPCRECGSDENLEINLRNPAHNIHKSIWTLSISKMQAELAKCDVLCYDCKYKPKNHGVYGYRAGCRCDICKEANKLRVYGWRIQAWGSISSKWGGPS